MFYLIFFFVIPKEGHDVLVILDTVIITRQLSRRFSHVPNLIREVIALRCDL